MSAKAVLSGMMKGLAIVGLVVAIGCGRDEGKDLANEGNQKLAAADASANEMNTKYQINLSPEHPALVDESLKTFDWNRYSPEQRQAIRTKLVAHISNIGRIKEITNHKSVKSGVNQQNLAMSGAFAQKYLNSLDAFIKAGGISNRALPAEGATSGERQLRSYEVSELEAKVLASAAILKVTYNMSVEQTAADENANRDWASVEKTELAKIKTRLQELQVNTDRLVQLASEGAEVGELDKKKASAKMAGSYLISIQTFESKNTSETKQGPVDPWPKSPSEAKPSSQATQSGGTVVTTTDQEAGL